MNAPVVVGSVLQARAQSKGCRSVQWIIRRVDGEDRKIGKASAQGAERFDIVRHWRFCFDSVAKPAQRPVQAFDLAGSVDVSTGFLAREIDSARRCRLRRLS